MRVTAHISWTGAFSNPTWQLDLNGDFVADKGGPITTTETPVELKDDLGNEDVRYGWHTIYVRAQVGRPDGSVSVSGWVSLTFCYVEFDYALDNLSEWAEVGYPAGDAHLAFEAPALGETPNDSGWSLDAIPDESQTVPFTISDDGMILVDGALRDGSVPIDDPINLPRYTFKVTKTPPNSQPLHAKIRVNLANVGISDAAYLDVDANAGVTYASVVLQGSFGETGGADGLPAQFIIRKVFSDGSLGSGTTIEAEFQSGVALAEIAVPDLTAGTAYQLDVKFDGETRGSAYTTFQVFAGEARVLTIDFSKEKMVEDGNDFVIATVTAKDAAGNFVEDGTPVQWDDFGFGSWSACGNGTTALTTTGGKASVKIVAEDTEGVYELRATIDGISEVDSVQGTSPHIALTSNHSSLDVSTGEVVHLEAKVTDDFGTPVPQGTTVKWFLQKGTPIGGTLALVTTTNALGIAVLDYEVTLRRSNSLGDNRIIATCGSASKSKVVNHYLLDGYGRMKTDTPVIAGDVTEDGSVDLSDENGDSKSLEYKATSRISIERAPPNTELVVEVSGQDPSNPLVTLSNDPSVIVTQMIILTDSDGYAVVNLRSTGNLVPDANGNFHVSSVVVTARRKDPPVPGDTTVMDFLNVEYRVMPRTLMAMGMYTLKGIVEAAGGALAGGDSGWALLGDVTLGLSPLGVYTDVRDVVFGVMKPISEIRSMAAHNLQMGAAMLGILTSFIPVADQAITTVKKLAQQLENHAPFVEKVFVHIFKELEDIVRTKNISELHDAFLASRFCVDYLPILGRMLVNADFRNTVVKAVKNVGEFDKLVSAGNKLGLDELVATINRFPSPSTPIGDIRDFLFRVNQIDSAVFDGLRNVGKLGFIEDAMIKGKWSPGAVEDYLSFFNNPSTTQEMFAWLARIEHYAAVPNAYKLVNQLAGSPNNVTGAIAVLKTADHLSGLGDEVVQFEQKFVRAGHMPPGSVPDQTDIDIVTRTRVVQVKGYSPSQLNSTAANPEKLNKDILMQMVAAKAWGLSLKEPKSIVTFAVPKETPIPEVITDYLTKTAIKAEIIQP